MHLRATCRSGPGCPDHRRDRSPSRASRRPGRGWWPGPSSVPPHGRCLEQGGELEQGEGALEHGGGDADDLAPDRPGGGQHQVGLGRPCSASAVEPGRPTGHRRAGSARPRPSGSISAPTTALHAGAGHADARSSSSRARSSRSARGERHRLPSQTTTTSYGWLIAAQSAVSLNAGAVQPVSRSPPTQPGRPRRVQHQGDRAVVDGLDAHVGAEDTALDAGAEAAELGADRVVHRLADRAGCGGLPGGPAALARLAVQRELADHEHRGADVRQRLLLAQQAQVPDLAGRPRDLGRAVVVGDAEVDEQAGLVDRADDDSPSTLTDASTAPAGSPLARDPLCQSREAPESMQGCSCGG